MLRNNSSALLTFAALGHGIAYRAGVLHRDVSEGNVLIAQDAPFNGFIGDFDYSFSWKRFLRERGWKGTLDSWQQYVKTHEGIPDENADGKASPEDLAESEMRNGLKERTVSDSEKEVQDRGSQNSSGHIFLHGCRNPARRCYP